ncbi:coenzyme F420-0:L-glutamate ligase [Candidatus Bathyarchaeota archaeon]|nr:coenzyme F420-0:L-glutamate ligase [Candidatus Bathyarchaeota archaeon]MBS7613158.1 coenzyme F420-0:L-glutamate ligase [Candidatus Bathyarchaeota archaeon]
MALKHKYKALKLKSPYWKPGFNYEHFVVSKLKHIVRNGDLIVLSEKAVSTALGNIVDESKANPSLTAKLLTVFWMRKIWGYLLGPLCRLKPDTIYRLREYPLKEGSKHKETALRVSGLLQALKPFSEGGLDVVNLPYSYAALPLKNAQELAERIRQSLLKHSKKVSVVISDSDKTFSIGPIHLCSRPRCVKGLIRLGLLAYLIGASLSLKARATPVAAAGWPHSTEELLDICEIADKARGYGAGRNMWEAAARFKTGFTSITWEMLEKIPHYPIVVLRRI